MKRSTRLLTAPQQRAAAEALGAAFFQDPLMSYVFPNAATREKNLRKLFEPVIRCTLRYGGVEFAPGGEGVLLWISGARLPLTAPMIVRSGLIWMPLKVGVPAFKRLQDHEAFCDREIKRSAPRDFAYLWVVGVHPRASGKGIGKQIIQAALSAMRRGGHSTCRLRTDNPKNVPLYEHLGFNQIQTGRVPESELPYWVLSQTLA